jgi:hypothetical protein
LGAGVGGAVWEQAVKKMGLDLIIGMTIKPAEVESSEEKVICSRLSVTTVSELQRIDV